MPLSDLFRNPHDTRVIVKQHEVRTWTAYPISALVLGLLFVVIGSAVAIPAWLDPDGTLAPKLAGLSFAYFGAVLSFLALKGWRRRREVAAAGGLAPWRFDRRWDRKGAHDGSDMTLLGRLCAHGGVGLFLLTLHVPVLTDLNEQSRHFGALLGLFDVVFLGNLAYSLYVMRSRRSFGVNRVVFHQFPYFTGQPVRLTFMGSPRLASRSATATLHCIKEYVESTGGDEGGTIVAESIWRDSTAFCTDASGRAELLFTPAPTAPSTDLLAAEDDCFPHYWELEVTADCAGNKYRGLFLLPIYASELGA